MGTWAGHLLAVGAFAAAALLLVGCSLGRAQQADMPDARPSSQLATLEQTSLKPATDDGQATSPEDSGGPQSVGKTSEDSEIGRSIQAAFDIPPSPDFATTQIESSMLDGPAVWGIAGVRGYPIGQHVAANGVEFNQLFAANLDLNLWLWRKQGIYLFTESTFWGQKPGPGITNPTQGSFDFSKREFDLNAGFAWNFYGSFEARAFAYSFNNLNRGDSSTSPSGFNDGIGLENRYYLGQEYKQLGTADFDVARAGFLSVGYYPSKSMVDGNSDQFKPGAFLRGYFIQDLWTPQYYLFADLDCIAARSFTPTLLNVDAGLAMRPFHSVPRLEFRIGTEDVIDLHNSERQFAVYIGIRYVF